MRHLTCLLTLVGCLVLVLGPAAAGQQWTRFRGPNGTGVSDATSIPAQWTESDYNWKTELPGLGHSSPVVWGEKVFLLSADPEDATRYVACVSVIDGSILWTRQYPSAPHPQNLHLRSSYASCTPAVDAEGLYVAWSSPEKTTLLALDHEGQELWQLDLGPWVSQHGFGTSPMLFEDLVILSNSQQARQLKEGQTPGKSYMMAFDRRTGEERWRTPRVSTNTSYSVPCIYQPAGGPPELIGCSTGDGFYSLDPRTGRSNWSIDVFKMRTVSSPVIAGGLIFGSTGSGGGGNYVVAIRPGEDPELAYEVKAQAPYVPTPVANGELMFLWSDKGIVTCIEATTGNVYWRERVGGNYSGSPIRVRDKLYCIDEEGEVVVLAAGKQFQELGRNRLGEPSRSTPAVAGGRMYLRTYSHLISIGGKSL